ncbi:MAG: sialate O-acetylesterase [Muribaculaceae bacterium]|nr:sialate O-acetylesterase [Muribaculaceae bacterium]
MHIIIKISKFTTSINLSMKKCFILPLALAATLAANARVELPSIISDNMVLRQQSDAKLWGRADAGEIVTITPSWSEKPITVVADADGKWSTTVATPEASLKNQRINFKGTSNSIDVENVLIGEVWLCTGQSNMLFPVGPHLDFRKWQTGMVDLEEQMKDADYPDLRLFKVAYCESPLEERYDCEGRWVTCTPETAFDFSAVAFVFGRRLYNELHIPVGLILSAQGDTHAESWMKADLMKDNPFYKEVYDEFGLEHVATSKKPFKVPSTLWNGMIRPILGYTISGNIWYQGEANDMRSEKYSKVFETLIDSWRKEWQMPDMPFYYVQIAPFYRQSPGIREAQLNTFKSGIRNIGMAVTTDCGDSLDIHPRNKVIPGERLALWALNKQYGKNVAFSGPVYKNYRVDGDKIIIDFDYATSGLKTPDGEPLKGFFIAGNDRKFHPAKAVIDGDKVVVSAADVKNPKAVRYGYDYFFRVNLYNGDNLPASPFRTDNWK